MTKACHCSSTNTDILKLQNDNSTKQITIQFWNTETKTLLAFYKRYLDMFQVLSLYFMKPFITCHRNIPAS